MAGTNPVLSSFLTSIQRTVKRSQNKFYNCSYGANIEGSHHLTTDEFISKSSSINSKKELFKVNEIKDDTIRIKNISKHILDTSFNVCEQILDISRGLEGLTGLQSCNKIINMINNIIKETKNNIGQFRNIMSFNRLPLLILYTLVNYTDDDYRDEIVKLWVKDYEEYISFVKETLYKHLDGENHHVTTDWIERFN